MSSKYTDKELISDKKSLDISKRSFILEICRDISDELGNATTSSFRHETRKTIFNSLINLDFRNNYSEELKQKLKNYLKTKFLEPGTRIGTISGQSVMHGATQSELSAFHLSDVEQSQGFMTVSIENILNMSNCDSLACFIRPEKSTYVDCVNLRSLVSSITFSDLIEDYERYDDIKKLKPILNNDMFFTLSETSYPFTKIIKLKKHLLTLYKLNMRDIEKYLSQYDNIIVSFVTSNCLARVMICSSSIINISEFSKRASKNLINQNRKISNVNIVKINREWVLTSSPKNLSYLLTCQAVNKLTAFCNDITVVSKVYGIVACRDLIYESLSATKSFNDSFSMIVADYMTWSGTPKPFTKSGIMNYFGPLFEMYFEKPRESLTEWMLEHKQDELNNPYSQLMCGYLKDDFKIEFQ